VLSEPRAEVPLGADRIGRQELRQAVDLPRAERDVNEGKALEHLVLDRLGPAAPDPDDPRPLPVITVDEPSISMTVGVNTSPLAGRSGSHLQ